MAKVLFSSSFVDDLLQIYSADMEQRVYAAIENLERFPEMGPVDMRPSIVARFEGRARKVVIGPFDLLYVYDREKDELHLDALMSQRAVR